MPAAQVNFDDIDLDMEQADELAKFLGEEPEDDTKPDNEPDAEEGETAEDPVEGEAEEVEEPAKEEEVKAEEPAKDPTKAELEEIRAERARLQEQLNELTVSSMLTQKQLKEMAKAQEQAKKVPEKEPEGPTPEQILEHLDARITEVDSALTKAELEDPNAAAGLRKQLRQLERYYTTLQAQVQLSSVKQTDPEEIVQKAATEAQQQAKFNSVKHTITAEYPVLDAKSEYFNEGLRDAVHRIYNPMIREGADPTEALIEATALVMRANGVYSMSEWQAHVAKEEAAKAESEAKAAAEAAAKAEKAAKAGASRKTDAVKRNVQASKDVAPNIASTGKSNEPGGILDKYDFGKMSINEMMRLNDEELERVENALAMYE